MVPESVGTKNLVGGKSTKTKAQSQRDGEPPLITGWIPFIGKALEFSRDAHKFVEEQKEKFGDVFTVLIAGKYMTFIMDPLVYPSIIKHGQQLDFSEFTNTAAAFAFGYPPMVNRKFPGLKEEITRSFKLLQGDNLTALTESMMGNLILVLRQDHLREDGWKSGSMYQFCNAVMFEASFLTFYGKPPTANRHAGMELLREDFVKFDNVFPFLIAQVPIWLLGRTRTIREKLISYFLPHRISCWSNTSQFVRRRMEVFDHFGSLSDFDKAAHHFGILWASVGNTIPACFWTLYQLLRHPEALQVIRQEIQDTLRLSGLDFDRDVKLSKEQLDKLLYLESAINESFRLSSASMNIRVSKEDFSLQLDAERTVAVRKGDIIAMFPQSMHLDPEIYEEPQTFQFDRFIQDGRPRTGFYKRGQKLKYYLMPFGSGSSICPGRFIAISEIKQFLCLLLLHFDLQLEDGQTTATPDPRRVGLGVPPPTTDVHFRYRVRKV
uniref:25-hydroxycholesterol 7-alpha-hydroxylase n=1 Tax=Echeneis naucrates TaxID=173247 RepID=A0A665V469_ECHNA